MRKKISLIVIVGPTASGKSELAVRMAKRFSGEIISADSRQVYRLLDIGSAKVNGMWKNNLFFYKGIPHFCIDTVPPGRIYTVARFKKDAERAIKEISGRGHIPIIAGGTGFWIDALVYDMDIPRVAPSSMLRATLEKQSPERLFALLDKIDPRRAATIERKNPRRLIRAIEIAKTLGSVPLITERNPYRAIWIGLSPSDASLRRAIAARARAMIRNGLVQETKKLMASGVSRKRIREFGFEYAAAMSVIDGSLAPGQLAATLVRETLRYARRQMRWFGRNRDIHWITNERQAEQHLKNFFLKRPPPTETTAHEEETKMHYRRSSPSHV